MLQKLRENGVSAEELASYEAQVNDLFGKTIGTTV